MVFHQVRDGALISQRWSFIPTDGSIIIRERNSWWHQNTPSTSISLLFPDRMAQIEQSMLGKLPSLSPPGFKGLQRTDPVEQCCSEGDTERGRSGAGFDCGWNVEHTLRNRNETKCLDGRLRRRRHTSWGVKEPCSDSAVVWELHWRPEKSKTWVSFN